MTDTGSGKTGIDRRWSFSVQADQTNAIDWTEVDSFLRRLSPVSVHIVGNTTLARRWHDEYPDMYILHRDPTKDDGDAVEHMDMHSYVAQQIHNLPDSPRSVICVGNEPSVTPQTMRNLRTAIRELNGFGSRHSMAVGHWGTGNIDDSIYEWPETQALMNQITLSNLMRGQDGRGHIAWGCHEYFYRHVRQPGYDPSAGDTYLVGWVFRTKGQFQRQGLPVPPIWITEFGRDCGNNALAYCDETRGYRNPRRPLTPAQMLDETSDAFMLVYRHIPQVRGIHHFIWSDQWQGPGLFRRWETFNIGLDPEYRELILLNREIYTMSELDALAGEYWADITPAGQTSINIRSGAGTTNSKIDSFPVGEVIRCRVALPPVEAGQYKWVQLLEGKTGWAAAESVSGSTILLTLSNFEAVTPAPDPQPEPEPVPPLSDDEILELRRIKDSYAVLLQVYQELMAALADTMIAFTSAAQLTAQQATHARDFTQEQIDDLNTAAPGGSVLSE